MPEALIKGMIDGSATDADQETIILPAEQKWGFRLTGGSEFAMPVTVFQVSFIYYLNIIWFKLMCYYYIPIRRVSLCLTTHETENLLTENITNLCSYVKYIRQETPGTFNMTWHQSHCFLLVFKIDFLSLFAYCYFISSLMYR